MASTIKVTNIDTPDNTGNIIVDRPLSGSGASLTNLPAANLTGTIAGARLPDPLPAISGASLTNLPAGGDTRNFIIDGDFTDSSWVLGNTTGATSGTYLSTLWEAQFSGSGGSADATRKLHSAAAANVPTAAQSGHLSESSMEIGVNSADTVGANEAYAMQYNFTGYNVSYFYGQSVILSFWVKSTTTGTYCATLCNGNVTRTHIKEYTISAANTWEKKTVTFAGDTSTSGWLFNENRGARLFMVFGGYSSGNNTGAVDTWITDAGGTKQHSVNQVNLMASTSNSITFAQIGLYLGTSAPDSFLGESIGTVLNQIAYYVKPIYSGEVTHNVNTTMSDMAISHNPPMRVAPSYTHKDTTGTAWEGNAAGAQVQSSGTGILNPNSTPNGNTRYGTNVFTAGWSGLTGGKAMQINNGTTLFGILDARH